MVTQHLMNKWPPLALIVFSFILLGSLLGGGRAFAQSAPFLGRFVDNERWSMQDCMYRAKWALESEGYQITWTAGDAQSGVKGAYRTMILCDPTPEATMRVNVLIATVTGHIDSENERLWRRMRNPQTGGTGGGTGTSCRPFEGVWATNYTPITFRRSGNTVTGTYEYGGPATVVGTLTGNVLAGEWTQTSGRGPFRFVLSADGQSFTGEWRSSSGGSGAWNGRCQSP